MVAPGTSRGFTILLTMQNPKQTMKILEAIHDAVSLAQKFHTQIETRDLTGDSKDNLRYLGQCIRSMDFILSKDGEPNESDTN